MSFLTQKELDQSNFAFVGKGVRISSGARFYNPERISIGDNSRIDDFCILSAGEGGIRIGRHIHIGCYSSLIGREMIQLEEFSNVSGRVSIYSSNDDYSGLTMTNPTVSEGFKNVCHGKVLIGRHAIVGAGAVILPNVKIGKGCVVGALSLVKCDCVEFGVYGGIPAEMIGQRKRDLLDIEKSFLGSHT